MELFLLKFFCFEASLDGFDVGKVASEFFLGIKGSNFGFFSLLLFFGSLWCRLLAGYGFDWRDLLLLFL